MASPTPRVRCRACQHAPCRCLMPIKQASTPTLKELMAAKDHCLRFAPTMPRDLGRVCDCHRIEAGGLCTCSCDGDACGCSCPGCLRARGVDIENDELVALIADNAAVFEERRK